jgi:hypothetical protein
MMFVFGGTAPSESIRDPITALSTGPSLEMQFPKNHVESRIWPMPAGRHDQSV